MKVSQDFLYGNHAGKILKDVQDTYAKSQRRPVAVPYKSQKREYNNYQKPIEEASVHTDLLIKVECTIEDLSVNETTISLQYVPVLQRFWKKLE